MLCNCGTQYNTPHSVSPMLFLFFNIIIPLITTKQVMFQIDTGEPFGAQHQHISAFEWLSFVEIISLLYSIFHKSHCKTAYLLNAFFFFTIIYFFSGGWKVFKNELNRKIKKGCWSLPACLFFFSFFSACFWTFIIGGRQKILAAKIKAEVQRWKMTDLKIISERSH